MSTSIQAQLNEQWDQRFAELLEWRKKNGSCWVPKAEGPLGRWVARQRELRKTGKMLPERLSLLESIDFTWNTNEAAWAEKYSLLTAWTLAHGHCCVPTADEEIGMWVAKQRQLKRQGRLSKIRIRQLESLGFVWSTSSVEWEEKFGLLLTWKKTHGHLRVPFNEGELGWWVNTQRQNRRKGKLSAERERSLTGIGFIWEPGHYQRKRTGFSGSALDGSCEFVDPPESSSTLTIDGPAHKKQRQDDVTSSYNIEDLLSAAFGNKGVPSKPKTFDSLELSSCPSVEECGAQLSSAASSSVGECNTHPQLTLVNTDVPPLEFKLEPKSPGRVGGFHGEFTSPVSIMEEAGSPSSGPASALDMAFLNRPTTLSAWPGIDEKAQIDFPSGTDHCLLAQPF